MSKPSNMTQDICSLCLPVKTQRAVFVGRCREHLFYDLSGLVQVMAKAFDHAFWVGMALVGVWNLHVGDTREMRLMFLIVMLVALIGLRQSFRKS